MSINKTKLVAAFGAYYNPEGQNMQRLMSMIRQKTVTPTYAQPIIHDGEVYKSASTLFTEVVQAFQKKFTPKGDLEFIPNEIPLHQVKIDIALYPDDVNGSWAGFLGSITEAERKNWPVVRYMIEQEVIPQLHQDMEMKAYFKGSYVAPTEGTPGTAAGAIDGIQKKLDAALAETEVTKKAQAVTLSEAITKTNAFDMIEEFAENIDETLDGTAMTIYMSKKILKWYLQDKRNTHGQDINYKAEKLTIDFSDNVKLVSLPSMSGSDYVWATPDLNFKYIRRKNGMNPPVVETLQREVYLMLDWWEGIGFQYNPLIYVYKPV
ncbi:hypothetical protein [Flavobacterium beibuense]|uniref:hypothetical protein n=1 Tax=Flavobacterium beibuense TaxID=657326 RepID=UPI003A8FD222